MRRYIRQARVAGTSAHLDDGHLAGPRHTIFLVRAGHNSECGVRPALQAMPRNASTPLCLDAFSANLRPGAMTFPPARESRNLKVLQR
jgi:hypothetical protein